MTKKLQLLFIYIIIFSLFITSCQDQVVIETPQIETTVSPSNTPSQAPSDTKTPIQTSTAFPTFTATATSLPSATPSPELPNQNLANTAIPFYSYQITSANYRQLEAVATWGTGKAHAICLSPDGLTLAIGTNIGAFLYDSQTYQVLSILQTPFTVKSIAFSSNNQYIALGQTNQTVDIFSNINFERVTQLRVSDWEVGVLSEISILFMPMSNDLLYIVEDDENVYVNRWQYANWISIFTKTIPGNISTYIIPSIDILGVLREDSLFLQSLTFEEENDILMHPVELNAEDLQNLALYNGEIAPSTDGEFIIINTGRALIHWSTSENNITYRLTDYPEPEPDPCTLIPETCLNSNGGLSWECETKPPKPPIETVALTPDNIMILTSINGEGTDFRRAADGLFAWEIDSVYTLIRFTPSGEYFYGIQPDGSIEKRVSADGKLIDVFNLHPNQLFDFDFSPDQNILVAGFSDGWIRVFSVANGQMLGVLDGNATTLNFSPNGNLLAAGLSDGSIRIFELSTGKYFDLPKWHNDILTSITFSDDQQQLLTGSKDCTASLWDINYRYRLWDLTPGINDPYQITDGAMSPGNQKIYLSGDTDSLNIIEGTNIQAFSLPMRGEYVDMALSDDRDWLAVTGSPTLLFPILMNGTLQDPDIIETTAYSIDFSADNSLLFLAQLNQIEFWSIKEKRNLGILSTILENSQDNPPIKLVVSPDGTMIALGNQDGLITIFAIP
jgi:WD40 repeat protein